LEDTFANGYAASDHRVSDITAAAGPDISPHYLPDGRILFV